MLIEQDRVSGQKNVLLELPDYVLVQISPSFLNEYKLGLVQSESFRFRLKDSSSVLILQRVDGPSAHLDRNHRVTKSHRKMFLFMDPNGSVKMLVLVLIPEIQHFGSFCYKKFTALKQRVREQNLRGTDLWGGQKEPLGGPDGPSGGTRRNLRGPDGPSGGARRNLICSDLLVS